MNIVGRAAEMTRLSESLELRHGSALVLRGQPGAGKSTLLRWAGDQAAAEGMLVLTAAGVEAEFEIPYAGLHLLAASLPRGPREDLTAVLADEPAPARVGQHLLGLISELDRPVVLGVDDAHWLDAQSWTALTFLGRRLADDAALLLLAMRETARTAERLDGAGLAELVVAPLSAEASGELLDHHSPELPAGLRQRVLAEADGNPLGLIELAKAGPGAPLPLTERLERAFARAVDDLPAGTRTLVQVAALDDGTGHDEILDAARRLDPQVTADDLTPAVAARILVIGDGQVRFRHPLIRSGVRQAIGTDRRREMHAAIAAVLAGAPDRRIWHRAEAAAGPDQDIAGELERLGFATEERTSSGNAAAAFERAARLHPDPAATSRLLGLALNSMVNAGDLPGIRRLLDELSARERSDGERALHAYIEEVFLSGDWSGGDRAAHFLDTVDALIGLGLGGFARDGLRLFALRLFFSNPAQEIRDRVVAATARLSRPPLDLMMEGVAGVSAPLERGPSVAVTLRRYRPVAEAVQQWPYLMMLAALSTGALPTALLIISDQLGLLRRFGMLMTVGQSLVARATAAAHLGDVSLAETSAAEARSWMVELRQPLWTLAAELARGQAAALRGDAATARTVADRAEATLLPLGAYPMLAYVQLIRGAAALGEGNPGLAADELGTVFDPGALPYHPVIRFWAMAAFAEAAVAAGRHERLRALVAELTPLLATENEALTVGLTYARAVLADTEDGYLAALSHSLTPQWPFEQARLRHAYGRWLRRQRRVTEAREQLRTAADAFATLGTTPWAERADAELRATGERVERGTDLRRLLTPQELQIAELAAGGVSTRDIAARLFLSPRTVESHLYRTYRKAGVASRAELARFVRPGSTRDRLD